jgi:membrane protein implicated in regulation of membrane protease activity
MYEIDAYWFWWCLAVFCVVAELYSGTLYLLALAIILAIIGLTSYFALPILLQIIIGIIATALMLTLLRYKHNQSIEKNSVANNLQHMDIGSLVIVEAWQTNKKTYVMYRGCQWQAVCKDADAKIGEHKIIAIDKNQLHLQKTTINL